ncbi:Putative sensory transduction regulator [Kytococcus aerolatus]|uniref:Putative sensory transduction regulator n=1 Tax=Kytococcus aerolatus TaxID=592308 RepID=A0A212U5Y5_9MICO|nr:YbjN domain-containing protein [Kytococcus aerolatus]SNC73639.1 Putative sensory transduction regulator [Kytococcus aerolatus]
MTPDRTEGAAPVSRSATRAAAVAVVEAWVAAYADPSSPEHVEGVAAERIVDDAGRDIPVWAITLPGERKLRTVVQVRVGERSVGVIAFVVRNADENHEAVHRLLLRRNLGLPGIAYAVDDSGDVYLVGRAPLAGATETWLDETLGAILQASDGIFNEVLALGFRSAMQAEWDWRLSRGESTRNLEAFRHLLEGQR